VKKKSIQRIKETMLKMSDALEMASIRLKNDANDIKETYELHKAIEGILCDVTNVCNNAALLKDDIIRRTVCDLENLILDFEDDLKTK